MHATIMTNLLSWHHGIIGMTANSRINADNYHCLRGAGGQL